MLIFGWNAATAVFLIWLDTLLVSLQLGLLLLVLVKPVLAPPAGTQSRSGWWVGVCIGLAFAAPLFFAPPAIVGAHLHDALRSQFPQGPLAAAFDSKVVFLWIAIDVALRGIQVVRRAYDIRHTPGVAGSFGAQALDQMIGLTLRMLVLIALVWATSWFGRAGLIVFLFAVSAFLAYTELHDDWVNRLFRWVQQKEKEMRARAKDRAGR